MDPIEYGARQAVINCLKLQKGERVVLIGDRETSWLADEVVRQIEIANGICNRFVMEDFGPRSENGSEPLALPNKIKEALASAQVSLYIAQNKPGELQSFRLPLLALITDHGIRHAHMPGFTRQMVEQGMASDYARIQDISHRIHDVVAKASELRVTSPSGTDLKISLGKNYKWVVCDGNIKAGAWHNLPDGEIFTTPQDINGKVVIDGCLGEFFTSKYGDLKESPLSYEIRSGACVEGSAASKNEGLKNDFENFTFNTDENSHRVGEVGIGTNIGLKGIIGNILQDSKYPGFHIVLGGCSSMHTGATWNSQAYNIGVMRETTIEVDGKVIMKDGAFKL